ncbi:hypothetical protein J1N51_11405 [Psychrosphaera ytuae]|uniref:Uncharacterized protein n=1 Tax=Psychrosphaera ytuae TaxID=2820710 RepID=A0A975DA31_9GAMM|nr:hypothetical protein [Psychrosphaera ytuae]QTH63332.1 hypothetical protein J1N51_11405 [Psychrosphaera ytuae]
MNRETVNEEHFLISIEPSTVASAYLLIAQTGVLFSEDLSYRLTISSIQIDKIQSQKSYLFLEAQAEIHDITGNETNFVESIAAVGSFSQIYHHLVAQFEQFLIQKGLNILVFQEEKDA